MQLITDIEELRKVIKSLRSNGKKIGFVPTMGFLHEGHLSLVRECKNECDITVVSIFVNPTQFAPGEDLLAYPRDMDKDKSLLINEGVDVLFTPEKEAIYPDGFQTYIVLEKIPIKQEGEFRPSHFKGVATVVLILFNIVQPDTAYFGQKDAQQTAVIKQMVRDLKYDIKIKICRTVRDPDGLAMSSRNIYLNPEERKKALILYNSLNEAEALISNGERNTASIIKKVNQNFLKEKTVHLNYIRIVEEETFEEPGELIKGKRYYILIACKIGTARLIDNLLITA